MSRSFDASERLLIESLELVAESLAQDVGFGVAVISVLDDDRLLTRAAVAGEQAELASRGRRYPVEELERELARSDRWGRWHFVPHDRIAPDELTAWLVPGIPISSDPGSWHPLDLLIAPLYDEAGALRGTIALDAPLNGLRPDAQQRERLDEYARRAARAVVAAVERDRLERQRLLSQRIRHALREINDARQLAEMLEHAQPLLTECFDAHGSWLHLAEATGLPASDHVHNWSGHAVQLTDSMRAIAEPFAALLWAAQEAGVVGEGTDEDAWLSPQEKAAVRLLLDSLGLATALFVPLGSGPTPLGHLLLTREPDDRVWTHDERAEALALAHDLGAAIVRIRVAEGEAQLLRELTDLHLAKDQLMATVTHDLRNPLAALDQLLGVLLGIEDLPADAEQLIGSISQVGARMRRLTDQLLALSRAHRPRGETGPTDLGHTVHDLVDVHRILAEQKHVLLEWGRPGEPMLIQVDGIDAASIVANLIGNAVTYTPAGGEVRILVDQLDDSVVLEVSDTGIGIAPEDRDRIFAEFHRTTNPAALREPGSGLGLAIVRALVARAGGEVLVESELGKGSTFRVVLPASTHRAY